MTSHIEVHTFNLPITLIIIWGFPHSSVDKESACPAGDLSSIPGSERSAGEGIGYPPQSSWASLVAQPVKSQLGSIPGLENIVEKGKATHSCILAWRIPWTKEPGGLQSMGSQRIGHN